VASSVAAVEVSVEEEVFRLTKWFQGECLRRPLKCSLCSSTFPATTQRFRLTTIRTGEEVTSIASVEEASPPDTGAEAGVKEITVAESGAILLGVLGCGVAVFAVDYAFSDPGESWIDQIKTKLESHPAPQGEGRRRTPTPKRIGPGPQPRVLPQGRPLQTQQSRSLQAMPESLVPRRHDPFPIPQSQPQTWQAPPVQRRAPRDVSPTLDQAANLISKTFGGPPSTPKGKPGGADFGIREAQRMLNTFFQGHVIEEDGKMGPRTKDAIVQFQQAQKLPATGIIDQKTHDFLVQISSPFTSSTRTGAGASDWKSETSSLGKAAQDIISHAIAEGDPRTLTPLSKLLAAAGFSQAAAASHSGHDGVTPLLPPTGHGDVGPGF